MHNLACEMRDTGEMLGQESFLELAVAHRPPPAVMSGADGKIGVSRVACHLSPCSLLSIPHSGPAFEARIYYSLPYLGSFTVFDRQLVEIRTGGGLPQLLGSALTRFNGDGRLRSRRPASGPELPPHCGVRANHRASASRSLGGVRPRAGAARVPDGFQNINRLDVRVKRMCFFRSTQANSNSTCRCPRASIV